MFKVDDKDTRMALYRVTFVASNDIILYVVISVFRVRFYFLKNQLTFYFVNILLHTPTKQLKSNSHIRECLRKRAI